VTRPIREKCQIPKGLRSLVFVTASILALGAPASLAEETVVPFGNLDMVGNVWEWTANLVPGRHGNPPDIGLEMVGFRCAGDL
jgi:formylglycine-generating enzyme required for sulfatase activity